MGNRGRGGIHPKTVQALLHERAIRVIGSFRVDHLIPGIKEVLEGDARRPIPLAMAVAPNPFSTCARWRSKAGQGRLPGAGVAVALGGSCEAAGSLQGVLGSKS